jgi:hypothetical protein
MNLLKIVLVILAVGFVVEYQSADKEAVYAQSLEMQNKTMGFKTH